MQQSRQRRKVQEQKPTGLRARKAVQMRAGILAAAVALFQKLGYAQTTIGAICEKADVSLGTFYKYFDSKQAVLIAFLRDERQQGERAVAARAAASARDPIAYVESVVFADLQIDDSKGNHALWREVLAALILTSTDPASAIEIVESRAVYQTHVLSALVRLRDAGAIVESAPLQDLADVLYAVATSQFQDHVCQMHKTNRDYHAKVRRLLTTVLRPWLTQP